MARAVRFLAMPGLEVRVLGPMVVLRVGEPLPIGRSKLRDLLALLTAHSPEVVSADSIVDELWRGAAPPSARKVVQKHVSELRQLLGPATHRVAGGWVRIARCQRRFGDVRHGIRAGPIGRATGALRAPHRCARDVARRTVCRCRTRWPGAGAGTTHRAPSRRDRAVERGAIGNGGVDAADRRSGTTDHRTSGTRGAVEPADAGALCLRPPERRVAGLPTTAHGPGARTRDRALGRAAPTRAADTRPGPRARRRAGEHRRRRPRGSASSGDDDRRRRTGRPCR